MPGTAIKQLIIRIDTREQSPFDFASVRTPVLPLTVVRGTLPTGDYADDGRLLLPLREQCVVERKSLADLYKTVTKGHDRFERECERMAEYGYAAIVIEASWMRIARPNEPSPAEALKYLGFSRPDQPELSAELIRIAGVIESWIEPPLRRPSRMNPKAVIACLRAWSERYGVHVWACPGRKFAEQKTHRIIERWARDHQ